MKIRQAQFSNWGIIQWRPLTWAEYKKFEDSTIIQSPMGVANDIYRACLISGPSIQDATAGIVEFVVKDVYKRSAFSGSFDVLNSGLKNARRVLAEDFLLSARAVIAGLFNYTFEDMDTWDEETFLTRLTQAEYVAGKELPIGHPEESRQQLKPNQTPEPPPRRTKEISLAQQMIIDRVNGK